MPAPFTAVALAGPVATVALVRQTPEDAYPAERNPYKHRLPQLALVLLVALVVAWLVRRRRE